MKTKILKSVRILNSGVNSAKMFNSGFKKANSYLCSRLRDGNGCAARTMEPEFLMPSK